MTLWRTLKISVFVHTFICIICLLGSRFQLACGLTEYVPKAEINPSLDVDDHSEVVEEIEDVTIAQQESVKERNLDYSDVQRLQPIDVIDDFIVPGSGTKFSQLPHCSDQEEISHARTDHAALLVSTLDGFLHSYDLSSGSKRWQHHLGHKKLHSCSSAMVELMYDGKQGSIVSSLDGFLYVRSNEQTFNALPVSVDSLVDSTFKISDDVVISGNKVSTVYGLAASTGAELYQCDGEGCKQGETVAGQDAGSVSLTDSDDVLLIKKVMRNIYAADPLDGSPKFNLTAGLNHVELVRSGSCKAANRRGRRPEQFGGTALPRPLFDRPQGKVWGVNKDGSKAWTKQLPTQIVDAWILDEGELSKLDLLQPINVPALIPRAHHPDTNVPGMYVGVHGKGEMFLHLSEQTKNKVQSYIAYSTLKQSYNWLKVEAAIRPSISWKPFLASAPFMMPAYGQGNMLAIEYKPDTIPSYEYDDEDPGGEGNTALAEVHYPDYGPPEMGEDGDPMDVAEANNISSIGFYLYDDDDLVISPLVGGGGGSSPHLSVPHTTTRGSSAASGGASTIPPGPWQPRFVQEEHLDPDQETEIPRHVHTWDVTWHLGVTSRHVQLLVAGLCLLLSLRVLYRPWYDSIVWLITLPLAYFVKNIIKDLLRRDPEVQADVYTASHGPQAPVLLQNMGRPYRARGPVMLPTNQNMPPRSEHSSQTTDHQLSPSLALDYGFSNKPLNTTTVETITEVGNKGGFDSGSSMDVQQDVHSHTNLTEYSPYEFVSSQGEVQQEARFHTTSVQIYKHPRLQIPPPQGDFTPVYNVNIYNINMQNKTCSSFLPAFANNPNPSPNSLQQSNGEISPPSVPSSTAPTSTPSTTALHPSASESSMTNTSGDASASPRSRIMDYDLRDVLGSGGFGIVFKAYLELDDHEYAIKRIPLPSKVENQRRVLREVRVLAKLNHMNIVRYYSCWQETHSTDWVREYDQPWRQKLKAVSMTESFLSPVGDTTTSPTGSQTESSAALGRLFPLRKHSPTSTAALRRRCQSEPPEQEKSTGIEENSCDDLIVGQEYNPLYCGSSAAARKGGRHARSKKYATDNRSGSFSFGFGDGDGGNNTEVDDDCDSDSGCAKNGDEVSSSSSSDSNFCGAGPQMNLFYNTLNTINKDNDDSFSIVFESSKTTAKGDSSLGDNSDSIVFKDDSSSSSSSAAPTASDVRPSGVSDFTLFQDPSSSSSSNVHIVDPTTCKRTVSEGNDRPVSSAEGNKKRSKSVSVSRPSSLALRGQSFSDQSQSIKLYNEKEDEDFKRPAGKRSSIARAIKDFLYIQMELCERKSLKEWLLVNTDRPKLTVLKYFLDIVNAVEHVHDKRMMHRDLKPSNIFFELGKEDVVKVGDFGLGTSIADEEGNDVARTPGVAAAPPSVEGGGQHTQNAGTLSYMSPEQREAGKANYTYKVDIFSMGLILFEMLWVMRTGQEKSRTLQLVREMSFPPTFAEQHPEEHALLRLMLHEDPQQRPTTRGIRARQPLRRLQLPHHVDNIKDDEHFELIIKTHRRNTSSVSVTDLIPENEAPVQE